MTRTPEVNAAGGYTRESSANSDGVGLQGQQRPLFSLPNGEPASFLLHNFVHADLTRRIFEHGGRITDDDSAADVILTIRPNEYKDMKDKYAVSRKTYVRMSGFIDRCINARRFRLAPVVEKGVPGRRLGSRRTEFTEEDDENLCQYIAEVLPDKGEGGRTGHFIYTDLIRRADEFGQYSWAHRHPKDGWRERYRKNRDRIDNRIAEIVEGCPPALDGKGRYMFRRYGQIDQDPELNAYNDDLDLAGFDEEGRDSATDDEGAAVQTKRVNAQPEEEEEEEDEWQPAMHLPGAASPRNQDAEPLEEEAREQITRTRAATRRGRTSPSGALASKRRRKEAQQVLEEPVLDDLDATLRGAEVGDKLAEGPDPSPVGPEQPNSSATAVEATQPENGRRGKPRARPVVRPVSPRRTRARSRSANPRDSMPTASRTITRAKAKASAAAAAATVPEPIPESQAFDEFVAHSDSDEEGEMHEVEANLQVGVVSRGAENQTHSPSAKGSRRLQHSSPEVAALADPDDSNGDEEDELEDDSDAELLEHVRKLEGHAQAQSPAPPPPPRDDDSEPERSSSEEIFPSPGTRAGAEKRRRTQAAKVAPYVPPRGTRAASMVEKERARNAAARRR